MDFIDDGGEEEAKKTLILTFVQVTHQQFTLFGK